MARPTGFEPVTVRLEGGCSIQLSYGRICLKGFLKAARIIATLPVRVKPSHPWSLPVGKTGKGDGEPPAL